MAIDVALTARRLGAKRIDVFCLESREEMPAHPWEIALAEEEGVFINNQWAAQKSAGRREGGRPGPQTLLVRVRCACNFKPVYDEEITHRWKLTLSSSP